MSDQNVTGTFSVFEVIKDAVRALLGHWPVILGISLTGVAISHIDNLVLYLFSAEGLNRLAIRATLWPIQLVGASWIVAALIVSIDRAREGNETPGILAGLRDGAVKLWACLVAGLLWFFSVLSGLILFIIPGVILGTIYCLGPCEAVLGENRGTGALGRSAVLVRPRFWWVFLLLLCSAAISYALMMPGTLLILVFKDLPVMVLHVIFSLNYLLAVPIHFSFMVCLYRSLQRHEEQPDDDASPGYCAGPGPAARAREEDRLRKKGRWGCLGAVAAVLLLVAVPGAALGK